MAQPGQPGNPAGSSPYPLASAVPKFATPSLRPDKIRRRQRAPDSLGDKCLHSTCTSSSPAAQLTLGHHFGTVISRSGQPDLGYKSVVLYAVRIMVSPVAAWPSHLRAAFGVRHPHDLVDPSVTGPHLKSPPDISSMRFVAPLGAVPLPSPVFRPGPDRLQVPENEPHRGCQG